MRPLATLAGLLVCALGCARGAAIQKLDGDSYRVSCPELPLDQCLGEAASNACDKRAYFVARGISDVNPRGRSEAPDVAVSSEAIIRCAPGQGWGDQGKKLMAPARRSAASTTAPSPDKPRSICAPGSTQSCVGAGACSGGQACKPDGSAYDACDCGSPTPAAPTLAPANAE